MTLRKSGFDTELCTKPETFEEFKEQMKKAQAAVVLVCSRDDDTYWEKTGGHYVNLFLYEEETEEVFLADPGSPDRNRNFIPLKYAYDALKTVSQYQYLLVYGYSEEKNQWKQDGRFFILSQGGYGNGKSVYRRICIRAVFGSDGGVSVEKSGKRSGFQV